MPWRIRFNLVFLLVALALAYPASADGVLRRGIRYEPATLDPAKYNTRYEAGIILDLFEGLLAYGPDGTPQPGLAEKWTVSSDGRVWAFTLRRDLRWSDGTALTADDVV